MAREIFLLDYDRDVHAAEHAAQLRDYAAWLGKLGVGNGEHIDEHGESYESGVVPIVFHDGSVEAELDAAYMGYALKTDRIYKAHLGPDALPMPFVNDMQCSALIVGSLALALRDAGEQLRVASNEHMVVVQPELAKEFLRVNPNGVARDRFHVGARSSVMNRYYIERIKLGERLSTAFPSPQP